MRPDQVPVGRLLDWLDAGTEVFAAHSGALASASPGRPTALPGWTIGHLLTHVARNADALTNLAAWAATGVETPMYPGGADQRLADIDSGAGRPAGDLLHDVADSTARLRDGLAALPREAWRRTVRTAQGRNVPAALIPWLRIREVWIHAVDLGTGVRFADLPADLAAVLLPDVVGTLATREGCPALLLSAPGTTVLSTRPGDPAATEVSGGVPALLGWLTGRTAGAGLTPSNTRLPTLPGWL
ncbi:mycothiol-dependent maleylpyruvate isomerase [Actinomadura rubteroloni]|uniref:Mycothiol-dependent maleylpyruvate isomerase n=1 Tax=Actinomadura rubteroloni TaxID=1926885 RepID=A0A2P4UDS0_9ACTN|nr:maleylpyruvate isomerase family mycothiol-dependent enzyme [Actinomadura rubteroloni]POM23176.1 mycothiol-dependent maleylpyruvate isomerase [Actinomadura rubteroloni]